MDKEQRKKIDWSLWKKKCPKCSSTKLEYKNEYKRVYKHKKDGYVLREMQKVICLNCKEEFWI